MLFSSVVAVHGQSQYGSFLVSLSPLWNWGKHPLTVLTIPDINCLDSINIHQALMNVDWFKFFSVDEFYQKSQILTRVHNRGGFLKLSQCQYFQQKDKDFRILAGRFSLYNDTMYNPIGTLGAEQKIRRHYFSAHPRRCMF